MNRKENSVYFKFGEKEHIAYRYEQLEILGKGTFGIVIKCMDHKSGEHVAIKLVKNLEEDLQQIEVEKDVLKLLSAQGNHIIKLYDTFQFRGFTCFVTELMSVDLYSYLTHRYMHGIPRSLCKVMLRQIACAIKSVHDEGFAHCDIKPENIMLLSHSSIKPSLKLIDFGCFCLFSSFNFFFS